MADWSRYRPIRMTTTAGTVSRPDRLPSLGPSGAPSFASAATQFWRKPLWCSAHQVDRCLFCGACETGVSPATSMDGFTVFRKTNAIHALHGAFPTTTNDPLNYAPHASGETGSPPSLHRNADHVADPRCTRGHNPRPWPRRRSAHRRRRV